MTLTVPQAGWLGPRSMSKPGSPTLILTHPKICIIVDTSLFSDEVFMISDCITFYHPITMALEDCKVIAGNTLSLYDKFIAVRESAVATHLETSEYKMGVVKISHYFILLSGPRDMSNVALIQQTNLKVNQT